MRLVVVCCLLVSLCDALNHLGSTFEVRNITVVDPKISSVERFQVVVLRATFDQPIYVNGSKVKHYIFNEYHQAVEDKANRHFRGLTRLICPTKVFESHPPLNSSEAETRVPSHLMPLTDVPDFLHQLMHLFDVEVNFDDETQFVSVLVLNYSPLTTTDVDEIGFHNLDVAELAKCQLRFLPEHEQTWLGSGILSSYDFDVFEGDTPLQHTYHRRCHAHHSLVDAVKLATFRAIEHSVGLRDLPLQQPTPSRPTKPDLLSHVFNGTMHTSSAATAIPPYNGVNILPSGLEQGLGGVSFFEFDIGASARTSHQLEVMECLALDQQQRLAEDLALEMKTKFIGALIQLCTVPIAGMIVPILCAVALAIMCIPIAMLIAALLAPYVQPLFDRLEKGSDSPWIQMMNEISPLYYGLWGVKKRRMTRLSQMLGTGILTPFMEQGSDGSGGWGPLIILCFGAIILNTGGLYQNLDWKMSGPIPRFVIQFVQLLVPASIGNFMTGPLAARVVKTAVASVTHNVVHNTNYAVTHSLQQSLTRAVTEAMHKQEKHYYYCLFCYYQGKYCEYCSTYNQYASAGKDLNNLTTYPE